MHITFWRFLEKLLSGFGAPSLSQSQDEGYWNINAAHVHQLDLRPSRRFILIYAAMTGLAAKHVPIQNII
jgi:hypothetical protein